MTDASEYTPPKVWSWNKEGGGRFAAINRPIAGPTHDKALPVGRHPLQLYSLATPNGVKVTVMLEELLARGHSGAHIWSHIRDRHTSLRAAESLDLEQGERRKVCRHQPPDRGPHP